MGVKNHWQLTDNMGDAVSQNSFNQTTYYCSVVMVFSITPTHAKFMNVVPTKHEISFFANHFLKTLRDRTLWNSALNLVKFNDED